MGKKFPLFSIRKRDYFHQGTGVVFTPTFLAKAVQLFALELLFLSVFGWAHPKANAQVTILHSFGDGTVPNHGAFPTADLIQAPHGNFYGETTHADSPLPSAYSQITP